MCKNFGFFGNFLSFINIVLNIAVSFEGCSGIEGDVFGLIKDSVGIAPKKNIRAVGTQMKNILLITNMASK